MIARIAKALKAHVPNPTDKKIEFNVSKNELKIRFDMNTTNFSLRSIKRLKSLRGLSSDISKKRNSGTGMLNKC